MSLSTSKLAYEDCYDILDRALAAANGIRVQSESIGQARYLQTRLNFARNLDRELNSELHPPGSPQHGVSIYDTLVVRSPRHEDGRWWTYIEQRAVNQVIEELGAAE